MAAVTKVDISYARQRFRRRYGKTLTPQAGRLIRELLNTVVEDPDPRWNASVARRYEAAHGLLEELPELLEAVSESESANDVVTAPDILHWLGVKLPERLKNLGFIFDKQ